MNLNFIARAIQYNVYLSTVEYKNNLNEVG